MIRCILVPVIIAIIIITHANKTTVTNPTANTDVRVMFTNTRMCMTVIMIVIAVLYILMLQAMC